MPEIPGRIEPKFVALGACGHYVILDQLTASYLPCPLFCQQCEQLQDFQAVNIVPVDGLIVAWRLPD